jgi:ubiquinone/menaquinone biosynthesis C-methylase UbiE
MEPKPSHLGLKYAEQFKDASIVGNYQYRPPYPDEVFVKLLSLMGDQPRAVLDVGCGTGDLCRGLAPHVERVDAVDFSEAMIATGKTLAHGREKHLRWICGRVEEAELYPPYALVTAGESLHWMDWDVVLPLLSRVLTPHGSLALAARVTDPTPWDEALLEIIGRFSTNREYRPYNLVAELEKRGLFQKEGEERTHAIAFTQASEDFIRSIHSRNGFSPERMGAAADAFDAEVRALLAPYGEAGMLALAITGTLVWGKPLAPLKNELGLSG